MVFIHGIGAPRQVEQERSAWTSALAEGALAAGHSRFASDLKSGAAETVFVHYGDLFSVPGAQGTADDLTEDEGRLLAEFMTDIIDEQLEDAEGDDARVLRNARAELVPNGPEQGLLQPVGRSINAATTLLSIPGLSRAGQWLSAKLLVRDFAQVARYLARAEPDAAGHPLDDRIRGRLHFALANSPQVLVAHSLGSVVAWETLHESGVEVPLFMTLGSPLGMRSVVWPSLRPQPPSTPPGVARWLNFWDRDDIIVARRRLERDVKPNADGNQPVSARVDSDGFWVHTATKYLRQAQVAGPIAEAALPDGPG
ncbi:hypothetical protein [Catenuloplanes indicus]|uniref:Alpha/beta hydrolase n=1 Tax=Catenuloplanes indicus TaxID=137267 RepID=A0AAE4AWJ1_9ACTN|nr:hypothetical protein [Catenuloplanes indicus]MDQ0365072.1 hypothetical protein [Catenuloplanes indicus]